MRNGEGVTDSVNALGNLIVGYNEGDGDIKTGSHNVVIGPFHSYTDAGGLVAGLNNEVSGPHASVAGGSGNTASGGFSAVTGGQDNLAAGHAASVGGGRQNLALGRHSSVNGGMSNVAAGICGGSTVGRGDFCETNADCQAFCVGGEYASVNGGRRNAAIGTAAAVNGGSVNAAGGVDGAIAGGNDNAVSGTCSQRDGSGQLVGCVTNADCFAFGLPLASCSQAPVAASILGGTDNIASATEAAVVGGSENIASESGAVVLGGRSGEALGANSVVLGGTRNVADGQFDIACPSSLFRRAGESGTWPL